MTNHTAETLVGAIVLAIAAGFLFLAAQMTGTGADRDGVSLYSASFQSVEGVSVGTDVRLGGVKVGTVTGLELDAATFRAKATFAVTDALRLPEDSAVLISSEGLLGGNFVEILPGGSPFDLEPGAEIIDTQSSVSLINLLLKFVSGGDGAGAE